MKGQKSMESSSRDGKEDQHYTMASSSASVTHHGVQGGLRGGHAAFAPANISGDSMEGMHSTVDHPPAKHNQTTTIDDGNDDRNRIGSGPRPLPKEDGKSIKMPFPSEQLASGKTFAKLVRKFEDYINDGQPQQFQPLNMFQQLSLCGVSGNRFGRLGDPRLVSRQHEQQQQDGNLHEPISIRHIHSTPLHHIPSLMGDDDEDDDDDDGPPILGLNLFKHRSRSTPLSTSANSAFGTIIRPKPCSSVLPERSAFLPPVHRSSFQSVRSEGTCIAPKYTGFNPIVDHNQDVEAEKLSIEVVDLTPGVEREEQKPAEESESKAKAKTNPITSTRASRFLSDMRIMRRRRLRNNRNAPTGQSAKDADKVTKDEDKGSKDSKNKEQEGDRSTTEALMEQEASANLKSMDDVQEAGVSKVFVTQAQGIVSERSSEPSSSQNDVPTFVQEDVPKAVPKDVQKNVQKKSVQAPLVTEIGADIDAEMDEKYDHFPEAAENSPCTVPSPTYHHISEDRPPSCSSRHGPLFHATRSKTPVQSTHSPMNLGSLLVAQTQGSQDSPGTISRTSGTTYTSGHTTHATGTTSSTGQLSVTSQTDREVMEANAMTTFLSKHQPARTRQKDPDSTSLNSSSTESTNLGYLALESSSPLPLRDGANLPAERFFSFSDPQAATMPRGMRRLRTTSSRSSKSSKQSETASGQSLSSSSRTSSSTSSVGDLPPTFVSYLDKKMTSDLTSLREETETTCQRSRSCQAEAREESPSEFLTSAEFMFEEDVTPLEDSSRNAETKRPTTRHGRLFGKRVRSLPPRSPTKGRRTPTTPPPRGSHESVSPVYSTISPPRNIVSHRPNVSKPYVLRTTPNHAGRASGGVLVSLENGKLANLAPHFDQSKLNHGYWPGGHRHGPGHPRGPIGNSASMRSRTYREHSIEILKTDSKEDSPVNFVSPEKQFDEA